MRAHEARLNRAERRETLAGNMGLGRLALPRGKPRLPVLEPRLIIIALVQVDIKLPVASSKPLVLQRVELRDSNAADFRPRSILEGVIIQEFAAQDQRDGQKSPDLTLAGLERALNLARVDPLCEVVQTKEDGGTRKAGRGENLSDEFAERRGNRHFGRNNAHRHFSNILRHDVDLVVEDGTNSTGHDGGGSGDAGFEADSVVGGG